MKTTIERRELRKGGRSELTLERLKKVLKEELGRNISWILLG